MQWNARNISLASISSFQRNWLNVRAKESADIGVFGAARWRSGGVVSLVMVTITLFGSNGCISCCFDILRGKRTSPSFSKQCPEAALRQALAFSLAGCRLLVNSML